MLHDVLKCPEARCTFKRTRETDEVALRKLAVALDALMAKSGTKGVATQAWWQPTAVQTTCPCSGKKTPAALPLNHNTLIRRALRHITDCKSLAYVRPMSEDEEIPGARYLHNSVATLWIGKMSPPRVRWRAKIRPDGGFPNIGEDA